MGNKSFSDELREEASPIWERILEHPFLSEMGEGSLPLEKFRFYVKQDYAYLVEFARCLGLAAAKTDDMDTMRTIADLLKASLTVEIEMLERLCEKIGVSPDELRGAEAVPTNFAYTRHLLHVAYSGTVGEIMASMLPCMWSYQLIGERLVGRVEHSIYGEWCATYISKEYAELVEWFKSLTDRCASESGEVIKDRMRSHFIVSSRYEYMFWDMAHRKEEWPV
jgi:thiaminase/transcriptional activator TenA